MRLLGTIARPLRYYIAAFLASASPPEAGEKLVGGRGVC